MNISLRKRILDIISQHIPEDEQIVVLNYLLHLQFQTQLSNSLNIVMPDINTMFTEKTRAKVLMHLVRKSLTDDTVSLKDTILIAQKETDVNDKGEPFTSTFADMVELLRKDYRFTSRGHELNKQEYTVIANNSGHVNAFKEAIKKYSFEQILNATVHYYTNVKKCQTFMNFVNNGLLESTINDMSDDNTPDDMI